MANLFNKLFGSDTKPVDVTDAEGPYVDAWTFPDPVEQADADLRKEIANLTDELERAKSIIAHTESLHLEYEARIRDLKLSQALVDRRFLELSESIDRAVGIRTATLQHELNKERAIKKRYG